MNLEQEKQWLAYVSQELNQKIQEMEQDIFQDQDQIQEFRKYMWENKGAMDRQELNSVRSNSTQEALLLLQTREYFKKLLTIKDSPYFAAIEIMNEEQQKQRIYIGMTYLKKKNLDNLIYDWRAPICSMFYDYESGPAQYEAPEGIVKATLLSKRQYKIEQQQLLRVIDSNIHIEDEVLQEVLASESGEKMKNIVTTIQQEQNAVIRNTKDRNLIVQGIAGSGKTSVALHRIAFLLYKIPNLHSNQILIFSPNQIFTEYISDVLPTLGEENTLQTTFHEYLKRMISEYETVESYPEFLQRFYSGNSKNAETVIWKQNDAVIQKLEEFAKEYCENLHFKSGFCENHIFEYTKEELDQLFHHKYNQAPLFERIRQMALKFSEQNYHGSSKKKATYQKLLLEALDIKKDYRRILLTFLEQKCPYLVSDDERKRIQGKKRIYYEDALLFVYLKGLLEGFSYDRDILQIVIDEAQDYSLLQYKILQQIFKNASFTILGDIHQTINPYYHYSSLEVLNKVWPARYIELNKTYRSSPEIIAFANQILHLHHVSAIQNSKNQPVLIRKHHFELLEDISYLKKRHKSVAIITHDDVSAQELYEQIKNRYPVSILLQETLEFQKEFVIIPAYLAKGLEFESVIVYQSENHRYQANEQNLLYVAVTRAQHELIYYE